MEHNDISPLMPNDALDYFLDGTSNNRLYLRATSVRNCLENIVETIFIHILDDEKKQGWNNKNLNARLNLLVDFFPDDINEKLHNIRKIGNKGAHQSGHKELQEQDIELTLNDLSKICEWTILAYFKKNGFTEHPWIPTVFSTLPPIYRIRILEELFESELQKVDSTKILSYLEEVQNYHNQVIMGKIEPKPYCEPDEKEKRLGGFLLLIDKLSMAYLKNRERIKSINLINDMFEKELINDVFQEQMLDKLEVLWRDIEQLPIAVSLEETRANLENILSAVKENEESLFITLFTAITSQNS